MTSLYRELNEAAFAMNLNKNQLLVFNAILNQTLGYGKTKDPLTDKRIAKMIGVRVDRVRPALKAIVQKGLFDRKPHKRYQYEYVIGKAFLEAHQNKVYTPSVPKKRSPSENENLSCQNGRNDENLTQMDQNQPEKATHTITNQTLSNQQQQTIQNRQTQNQTVSNQQQQNTQTQNPTVSDQQQPQQSVKLFFAELEHIPSNFAIETSANTRVEFAIGTATTTTATPDTSAHAPQTHTDIEPEAISTPETLATLKKLLAIVQQPETKTEKALKTTIDTSNLVEPNTDNINLPPQPDSHDTQPPAPQQQQAINPVCCRDDNVDEKPQDDDHLLVVPQAVGAENMAACNRAFSPLSPKQKQDVLNVFKYNNSMGTIKNATGYFIGLTKSAKAGSLTVPSEAIVKAEPSAEKIAADKEQQRRYDLWSKFTWLQENAGEHDTDLSTFAQQMGMEEAYAMYAHTLQTMN